jgi:hypothetical protein
MSTTTNVNFPVQIVIQSPQATGVSFPVNIVITTGAGGPPPPPPSPTPPTPPTDVRINISDPIITSALNFISQSLLLYVDEDRELKTLLNYGEDRQSIVLAKRYGPLDSNNINSIQLKLLQPVPEEIDINSGVFLSREVAKSIIDKVHIKTAPAIDNSRYLRPLNPYAKTNVETGNRVRNVTLNKLALITGSVGATDSYQNKTFEDQIFRKWYSYDFNSSELNIDFTDYNNFIYYSSAAMRLEAFKQKIKLLENIERDRLQFLSSSLYVTAPTSSGFFFVQEKSGEFATKKEEIIRSFDRYEQFLYFTPSGSSSPYSASAYYADSGIEYNVNAYWPKNTSNELYSSFSSQSVEWFETQYEIATRFDEFNENSLVNTIPTHVRQDDESASYITFVSMIAHIFDSIKLYIDQFPNIYSRNLNPNEELSKDLINEIAESVGFKLPSLNSVYSLTDDIFGSGSIQPRRDIAAEIYKRMLHNLPFFAKAKGTKTALETFLKTFGITPQLISVRETETPSTASYYVYDEFTTGLDFDEGTSQYVIIPVSASVRNPRTMQFNCTFAKNKKMTILTGDNKWALNVNVHPFNSNLGRIELSSGSGDVVLLSSSYHEIFGDELINITLQNYTSSTALYVTQVEGEDVLFSSITSDTGQFISLWEGTQFVNLGGVGPLVSSRFDGTLDEFRLWSVPISDETVLNTAFDPASNAAAYGSGSNENYTYTAPTDSLLVQLSFNDVNQALLQASSSLENESPYKDIANSPSLEFIFASNVSGSSLSRYNRTTRQPTQAAGSTAYVSNKIKIKNNPVFLTNEPRLFRTKSILPPEEKRLQRGRNKVVLAAAPTEIVNKNIIQNLGLENINSVIGIPWTFYNNFEKTLTTLKNYYNQYYYVDVNYNKFIRIVSEVVSVFDQVADYFIPSRATALKGVVIEPNVLEQVKIKPVRDIRFYGKNTRRTINAAGSLTSSKPDYGATFNFSETINATNAETVKGKSIIYKAEVECFDPTSPQGNLNILDVLATTTASDNASNTITTRKKQQARIQLYKTAASSSFNTLNNQTFLETDTEATSSSVKRRKYVVSPLVSASSKYSTLNNFAINESGSIVTRNNGAIVDAGMDEVNKIPYNAINYGSEGAEPYNRIYTRKLFVSEINTPRLNGITSLYIPALKEIPPSADFRDYGVYTFFNSENGIYYFTEPIKTPTYINPLNQTWNTTTQNFNNSASINWEYGKYYNLNDVVYQDISGTSLIKLKELFDLTPSNVSSETLNVVREGNGNYYVFKSRPSYRAPTDNTTHYLTGVPSYLPPSVDKVNWEKLKFIRGERIVPKRVIFDTFIIPEPRLNNYKTTTVSINRIIDIPTRYVDTHELPAIASGSFVVGDIVVQNVVTLFAIQLNTQNVRMRLYRTEAQRTNDLTRSIEQPPQNSHGVLLDTIITTANQPKIISTIATLVSDDVPSNGKIYYTLDNLDNSSKFGLSMFLYYFTIEVESRIPKGYLRKHYRFFRDNSTATKRRNYIGCKNTRETTIDGRPPVEVFLSEGNTLRVSPSVSGLGINTGGGGRLDAT